MQCCFSIYPCEPTGGLLDVQLLLQTWALSLLPTLVALCPLMMLEVWKLRTWNTVSTTTDPSQLFSMIFEEVKIEIYFFFSFYRSFWGMLGFLYMRPRALGFGKKPPSLSSTSKDAHSWTLEPWLYMILSIWWHRACLFFWQWKIHHPRVYDYIPRSGNPRFFQCLLDEDFIRRAPMAWIHMWTIFFGGTFCRPRRIGML